MKVLSGSDSMDLGFQLPQPGTSICVFDEGLQKRTNENSGKTTLQIPMVISQVIEGPQDNVGLKIVHFCPIETEFGEKQLANILHMTGLDKSFAEKFGDEIDPTDQKIVNALTLKLVGKQVKVKHEIRMDNKGREQVNITNISKWEKKQVAPEKADSSKPEDW